MMERRPPCRFPAEARLSTLSRIDLETPTSFIYELGTPTSFMNRPSAMNDLNPGFYTRSQAAGRQALLGLFISGIPRQDLLVCGVMSSGAATAAYRKSVRRLTG